MKRDWIQGMPWYEVHFAVHKGTDREFDNQTDVQANSSDEAMEIARQDMPNVYVWAAYRKQHIYRECL